MLKLFRLSTFGIFFNESLRISLVLIAAAIISLPLTTSSFAENKVRKVSSPKTLYNRQLFFVKVDKKTLDVLEAQLIAAIKNREVGFTGSRGIQAGLQVDRANNYFSRLGLRKGDVILSIDKLSIDEYTTKRGRIEHTPKNLLVNRNGKKLVILFSAPIVG